MSHDIVDKFSSHLKNVLTRALCFVVEMNQKTIQPEHLLWALATEKGCIGSEIKKKVDIKTVHLKKLVGAKAKISNSLPEPDQITLHLSDDSKRIVEKAVLTANIYNHKYVGTEHLLSGILQVNSSIIEQFFVAHKIDTKELKHQLSIVLKTTSKFPDLASTITQDNNSLITQSNESGVVEQKEDEKNPALEYFARELTSEEAQKKIDPVIGREKEIERLMEILSRRTKNNPMLMGEPGVGKTAIVEGLAKKIYEGNVPAPLQNKQIFALDMTMMIAGTMYRGEFEGRLRQVMDEIKKNDEIILFIDEIHTIVGAGAASGSLDAANILKPALARGEIRCIGATTPNEYKKHIESDNALERRFQSIYVDEPSYEKSIEILQGITPYYESFHSINISYDAIEQAVKLSSRYIQDKFLPDKAIDLIDEASAAMRIKNSTPGPFQKKKILEHKLNDLNHSKRQAVVEERFTDALTIKEEEEHTKQNIQKIITDTSNKKLFTITGKDIACVISKITGIPINDLIPSNQDMLMYLEKNFTDRIIGQDDTIRTVASALRRAKTGVIHPKRPLSSFMFLGPSGVGKTELAKVISEIVFHDIKNLIRLDMSEYGEAFTVSKLIGAPAGYVGYKDQSNLTDKIKQRPYSVVLFDELEKAHTDVQNLLLQILEEGELTDATGRKVNFKNTVIIITSNAGLERFEQGGIGFSSSESEKMILLNEDLRTELEQRFRPEMLNRLDNICIFQPLNKKTLEKIVEKEMKELTYRMNEMGLEIKIHDKITQHVCSLIDPRFGARTVRQKIQQEIETRIAERLSKKDKPKSLIIKLKGSKISVTKPRRK